MHPINTKNCQLNYKALGISNEIFICLVFGILMSLSKMSFMAIIVELDFKSLFLD